jgi:UDP-N-acetylglucosamine 2-epimerase
VDIGSRQEGRLSGNNLLRAPYVEEEIEGAIQKCISDKDFIRQCHACINPYGNGNSGPQIAKVLSEVELGRKILTKKMTLK